MRVGQLLSIILICAFVWAGSTRPLSLMGLHLLIGLACVECLRMSQDRIGASGRTQRLVKALMCLMIPALVSLLPVPEAALEWLAPGAIDARGGGGFGVFSLAPDRTVGAFFEWWLACGFVAVLGLWCAGVDARHIAERAAVWGLGIYVVVAGGHAFVGAESVFGILEVQGAPERLLLPLVNPNHAVTPVLLVLPVVIGRAVEQIEKGSPRGWGAALVVVASLVFLFCAGSVGGWLALAAMGFVAWLRTPSRFSRPVRVVGVLSIALVAVGIALQQGVISEAWLNASWRPRFAEAKHYGATMTAHWFAGVGPGAFFEAAGLNSGHMKGLTLTEHAHIGVAEWFLETGLVGVFVLGLSLAVFPRWNRSRRPERAWRWTLGLVGVGTHCLVDFPLQIRAIFLLAVAVLTVRMVAYSPLEKGSARAMRRLLVGLAVAQVFGAAWQAHAYFVEREAGFALEYEQDATRARQAERRLSGVAPWRMEAGLVRMWNAEVAGETAAALEGAAEVLARHPDDPDALRHAGYGFLRLGEVGQAEVAFTRAVERRPSEYRAWLMLSGIAEGQGRSLDAAKAMLRAIRHWPTAMWPGWWTEADPLIQGYEMLPVGIWWVEGLSDANGWWSALLGGLLLDKGDAESALLAFEQAEVLGPFWVRNRVGPAQALVALGRLEEAESYLQRKIQNGATHAELWKELALIYARQGKEDAALKLMQEGIVLTAKKDDFAGLAVRDIAEVASDELGIRLGERLVLVGHAGPVFSTNLAVLYYRVDRKVDCRRMLDQAEVMMQAGLEETWDFLSPRCGPGP